MFAAPCLDARGACFVAGADGRLCKFSPRGEEAWAVETRAPVFSAPQWTPLAGGGGGGVVFFGSHDGEVPRPGQRGTVCGCEQWRVGARAAGAERPGAQVRCVCASRGALLWSARACGGGGAQCGAAPGACAVAAAVALAPALRGHGVCVAAAACGRVAALDLRSGALLAACRLPGQVLPRSLYGGRGAARARDGSSRRARAASFAGVFVARADPTGADGR